jgi:hypothetical protein
MPEIDPVEPPVSAAIIDRLVRNHREFLSFLERLERRLGNRVEAEDILQKAFVKGVERADCTCEMSRGAEGSDH